MNSNASFSTIVRNLRNSFSKKEAQLFLLWIALWFCSYEVIRSGVYFIVSYKYGGSTDDTVAGLALGVALFITGGWFAYFCTSRAIQSAQTAFKEIKSESTSSKVSVYRVITEDRDKSLSELGIDRVEKRSQERLREIWGMTEVLDINNVVNEIYASGDSIEAFFATCPGALMVGKEYDDWMVDQKTWTADEMGKYFDAHSDEWLKYRPDRTNPDHLVLLRRASLANMRRERDKPFEPPFDARYFRSPRRPPLDAFGKHGF